MKFYNLYFFGTDETVDGSTIEHATFDVDKTQIDSAFEDCVNPFQKNNRNLLKPYKLCPDGQLWDWWDGGC